MDVLVLEVNDEYERQTHLHRDSVIGKQICRVLPIVEPEWFEMYGRVVNEQRPLAFEQYCAALKQWFSVNAIPLPGKDHFAAVFRDITERKAMASALKDSEAKLHYTLESMAAAVLITDADGNLLDFNEAFAKYYRFKSKDECLRKVSEYSNRVEAFFANMERAPQEMWAVPRALRGETATEAEYLLRMKDTGEEWWGSYSFGPIRNEGGNIIGSVVVLHDITEKKRLEQELDKKSKKFQALVETNIDFIWEVDNRGRYTYCSPQMEKLWGLKPGDMIGRSPFDMMPSPAREMAMEAFMNLVRSKTRFTGLESISYDGAGNIIFIETSGVPILDPDGELIGFHGITRDVTERKLAETALKESEERLALALSAGKLGAWDYRLDTGVIVWNDEHYRMLGYKQDEVRPSFEAWLDRVHPDDKAIAKRLFDDAMKKGGEYRGIIKILWPDGNMRWIEAIGNVEVDSSGKALRSYGVLIDTTAQKKAEEELIGVLQDLKRSNAELEQFAYVSSHDLKEPLRMISGFLGLLEKRYGQGLDADARNYIQLAVDGAKRMDSMIEDLLEYSRVGRLPLKIEFTSMDEVFEEAIQNLTVQIKDNGAMVSSEELPKLYVDRAQMRILMQNLIGNAIKFHNSEPPDVKVWAVRGDGGWVFGVKDNGIGFSQEYSERIFLMFERLHSKEKYPGTGIGLAICKKIIERHGGRIWAVSAEGKGSTFYFAIPERNR